MTATEQLRAGVVTASAEETQRWAIALAAELPRDAVLALHGNLGVGKTTFVQGLARAFGVIEHVTSPTFTIFNLYRGRERTLVHLDAYRLGGAAELETLMVEDFLTSPYCLAIEWPENIGSWLPATAWHLELGIGRDQRHTLRLR